VLRLSRMMGLKQWTALRSSYYSQALNPNMTGPLYLALEGGQLFSNPRNESQILSPTIHIGESPATGFCWCLLPLMTYIRLLRVSWYRDPVEIDSQ